MKQVTLDWETYNKELLAAKQEGFELIVGLEERLRDVSQQLNKVYNRNDLYAPAYKLNIICDQLSKINFNKVTNG